MLSKPSDERLPGANDASASPQVGLAEPASPSAVAKLISLEEGFYAVTLLGDRVSGGIAPGFAVPAVHISAPPQRSEPMEISDTLGRSAEWFAAGETTLFVKAPAGGGAALVTVYPGRDPRSRPLQLEIRRLDRVGFAAARSAAINKAGLVQQQPFATIFLADPIPVLADAEPLPIEIVLHVRRRGDVRFVDAPWAGRLGPGLWIESFTILPRQRSTAAAIECKGLTAAGVETDWLSCGLTCGSRGMDTPLVGFAVRQKDRCRRQDVRLRIFGLLPIRRNRRTLPERGAVPLSHGERSARRHAAAHPGAPEPPDAGRERQPAEQVIPRPYARIHVGRLTLLRVPH